VWVRLSRLFQWTLCQLFDWRPPKRSVSRLRLGCQWKFLSNNWSNFMYSVNCFMLFLITSWKHMKNLIIFISILINVLIEFQISNMYVALWNHQQETPVGIEWVAKQKLISQSVSQSAVSHSFIQSVSQSANELTVNNILIFSSKVQLIPCVSRSSCLVVSSILQLSARLVMFTHGESHIKEGQNYSEYFIYFTHGLNI